MYAINPMWPYVIFSIINSEKGFAADRKAFFNSRLQTFNKSKPRQYDYDNKNKESAEKKTQGSGIQNRKYTLAAGAESAPQSQCENFCQGRVAAAIGKCKGKSRIQHHQTGNPRGST